MAGVALVTGGNRGIGLAAAQALRAAGWTAVVGSRSGDAPDGLTSVAIDVTSSESVDAAFDRVESDVGPIDVLVANAGITRDGLVMRMPDADIDDVLQTNLVGAIRCARRAARAMVRARRGRIVFVSSVVWALGSAGQVNYAASKAGLVGAARSLARELGGRGITVNVVAPGFVDTDMTAVLGEERTAEILRQVPLGRLAEPDEIARVVAFLAGDDAGYITGAVIPVDGGLGMGH
ncbi:MAG: SDR family oxidoreductase [Actinobacteria bacterium]|nr:SDR family oxidoreductase [Actinomycetota bacterium]